jgi:hypothetical protein
LFLSLWTTFSVTASTAVARWGQARRRLVALESEFAMFASAMHPPGRRTSQCRNKVQSTIRRERRGREEKEGTNPVEVGGLTLEL